MLNDNFSPFNEIPSKDWKKFKNAEKRYSKIDNEIFECAIAGHMQELKSIFDAVINSKILGQYECQLAKNIWERYNITGKISATDLYLVDGWYSIIVSAHVSTAISKSSGVKNFKCNHILDENDGGHN